MKVTATRRATSYVRKHGSSVYLWTEPGTLLSVTTDRPEQIEFRQIASSPFETFIEEGLKLGTWIRIQRDPFPPWRLLAVWEGLTVAGAGVGPQ